MEQTKKNLEEALSTSEGGIDFDDHGSEGGIPPEVAAEDDRFASREATHGVVEEIAREKEREQREDDAADEAADSSVEEVQFVFPYCPPPNEFYSAEREACDETVALVKHCRKTGIKLPIKIPSNLAGKWSKA